VVLRVKDLRVFIFAYVWKSSSDDWGFTFKKTEFLGVSLRSGSTIVGEGTSITTSFSTYSVYVICCFMHERKNSL
jgi:hypothetical protein